MAIAPFPVITFGPFPTPEALLTSLAHATGMVACDHLEFQNVDFRVKNCLLGSWDDCSNFSLMCIFVAGTMKMPPKWAIGYQQCRWSYETAARVSEVYCLNF